MELGRLIQELNDVQSEELALPGNWSSKLFITDFQPDNNLLVIAEYLFNSLQQENPDYLKYYQQVWNKPHPYYPKTEDQCWVWKVFSTGSIMYYFEDIFLEYLHVEKLTPAQKFLVQYCEAMSNYPIYKWDSIVKLIGACCYNYFVQEPDKYVNLLFKSDPNNPDLMTDDQIIEKLNVNLTLSCHKNNLGYSGCRSTLIDKFKATAQ